MATFRKRGNKWSFRIDIGNDPVTNERRQPTISKTKEFPNGFSTKKEAQQAAAQMEYELTHGTHIQEADISFKDLVDSWMNYYEKDVKVSTVRVRKHESGHLIDYFGVLKARQISKKTYQDALIDLRKTLSESTVSGIHATGSMIFKYAKKFDMVKVNPTEYAKVPKDKKTVEDLENTTELPKYLEKEELSLFLQTAKEKGLDGDYEMFLFLSYSGIRAGELCALKDTDLNFADSTASITKTYYNPSNNIQKYQLITPKTRKSVRVLELEPIVFEEIKKYQARRNEVKMANRKIYHDKGFLFVNFDRYPGYPKYIKMVENRMNRLLKLAGLNTSLTPHSLRHTHTSLCAEAGASLDEIMDRLGHKDDDTTKSVYLHVTKTRKKEVSKKFGNLMKSVTILNQ